MVVIDMLKQLVVCIRWWSLACLGIALEEKAKEGGS
jgi:hypothetical protein